MNGRPGGHFRKLQDMTGYCESTACRRKYLLTYFGEEFTEKNCGSCDNCDHPKEQFDGTEIGQMILACVRQLPSHFGIELITDVLTGSGSARIRSYQLDVLPVLQFRHRPQQTTAQDLDT